MTAKGHVETKVTLAGLGGSATITVKQVGAGYYIIANPAELSPPLYQLRHSTVESNVEYAFDAEKSSEWISVESKKVSTRGAWTLLIINLSESTREG